MEQRSKVFLFIDNEKKALGEFDVPVKFDLDTRKLTDGNHTLKIVSKDPTGKEGIKLVNFVVRNGPSIDLEGLKNDDIIDGVQPIMINAYGKGNQKEFLIDGSESPASIPSWLWAGFVVFFGWAMFYLITS